VVTHEHELAGFDLGRRCTCCRSLIVPICRAGIEWLSRMVPSSGDRGIRSTNCRRPMSSMSRELGLVAGRLCDSPSCPESTDP
jgi:hypothetical protein